MARKKKKKRKIPTRTQLRRAGKRAHNALSLYARELARREYKRCPLCGVGEIECVFHFIRSKFSKFLRYEIRNVVGACHKCNWIEYRNPDPSRAWYIRRHGVDAYLKLVDDHAKPIEYTLDYYAFITDLYTGLLNELPKLPSVDVPPPHHKEIQS